MIGGAAPPAGDGGGSFNAGSWSGNPNILKSHVMGGKSKKKPRTAMRTTAKDRKSFSQGYRKP